MEQTIINMHQTNKKWSYRLAFCFLTICLCACSDFVEVDPPKNILVSETVFSDPATVSSALANLYHSMREEGMVSGDFGLTPLLGIYSDEMDYYGNNAHYAQLYYHNVTGINSTISGWWSQGYHLIYATNDIIAGVEASQSLAERDVERFKGQALFVRAYIHSLLLSLFGDIPYVTTTDYQTNNRVGRLPVEEVYARIESDLLEAVQFLEENETSADERVVPDHYTARALMARMALYTSQWELAERSSSALVDAFHLENQLEAVFLKESQETIWQLKAGESPKNTEEADELVIQFLPVQRYALSESLLNAFEEGDGRLEHWTNSISDEDGTNTFHYAHKYKALFTETASLEYSIVFRVAEQYLIRAEARAHLGNFEGALEDLNAVRKRAGLEEVVENSLDGLLDAIFTERQVELFVERGHRWFDLKRSGSASHVLGPIKSNWKDTDVLLPLPEAALENNPNLLPQNTGY